MPAGTTDSGWLKAFHAVVPPLLAAFRPEVLVTQCGVDSHREDPLAGLSLTVDGHYAIYQALRECAERYAAGKWLALGGGGYSLFRVVPRSWTHLLATMLDRDLDPTTPTPASWRDRLTELDSTIDVPITMTDDVNPSFDYCNGTMTDPVDAAIRDTRTAIFPLHGLRLNAT